jgi:DNA-binding NtrC family response regulator
LLTRHFLTKYTRESQKRITRLSDEALHLLMTHSWPGNVRELEHVIERAVVLCQSEVIHHRDVLLTNSSLTERRESLQEAKLHPGCVVDLSRQHHQGRASRSKEPSRVLAANSEARDRRPTFQIRGLGLTNMDNY